MKQSCRIVLLGAALLIAVTACDRGGEKLRNGDLIFESGSQGEFAEAIEEATGRGEADSFVHVGIVEVADDGLFVIEASPSAGVCRTPFDEFVRSSGRLTVKRLTVDCDLTAAVARAKSHLGEGYDLYFMPDNGAMYCSELVWECYVDAVGRHVFEAQPMNFRAADGTMPDYWVELFASLGKPIPEGVEGTNPADLARSPLLREVATDCLLPRTDRFSSRADSR